MRKIAFTAVLPVLMFLQSGSINAATPGDSTTEKRTVNTFNVLKIDGNFTVLLVPGSSCSLSVTADKSVLPFVESKNSANTLSITMKQGAPGKAVLAIGFKELDNIDANLTGPMTCTKEIKSDILTLTLAGSTGGSLTLDAKMLTFKSTSDKDVALKGKAKKCNAVLKGDGNTDMSELKVDDMTIEKSDDGDVKLFAHPDLNATMEGTGKIIYYGNPKKKIFHIHGDGRIIEGK